MHVYKNHGFYSIAEDFERIDANGNKITGRKMRFIDEGDFVFVDRTAEPLMLLAVQSPKSFEVPDQTNPDHWA